MNHPPQPNTCPQCSAVLPADAPQGLCPACLLAAVALPTEAGTAAPAKAPAPTREQVATAFPQLEILELIGAGGMGYVFKARQPKLDRLVALKLLPQHLGADAAFAGRFEREGRVLARLSHPNIVTVHDFGFARAGDWQSPFPSPRPPTDGDYKSPALPLSPDAQPETPNSQPGTAKPGFYYLLMEFVDGVNLRQAMRAGRFTPVQALEVVPKICEALQFAHEQGILHRDIKPENILLDAKGRVKLVDFGIAKLVDDGRAELPPGLDAEAAQQRGPTTLTSATAALGTPSYMAPEQRDHPAEVDHRADIYSLGVVFYEMLTGELPVGKFAPPSAKSASDPRVDEVVLRALEQQRERRQQSAGEVKTQVETIASSPGSSRREAAPIISPESSDSAAARALSPVVRWSFLAVIIFLFVSGCYAAWKTMSVIGRGEIGLNLGVLLLPAAIGLHRRRAGWRICALAFLWFGAVFAVITAASQLTHPHEPVIRLGGTPMSAGATWWQSALLAAGFWWLARVLSQQQIRAQFATARPKSGWGEWAVLLAALLVAYAGSHVFPPRPASAVTHFGCVSVGVSNNVVIVDVNTEVWLKSVALRAELTGPRLSSATEAAARELIPAFSGTFVHPTPHTSNAPSRILPTGRHTWRIGFVLPSAALAQEAERNLRRIGPLRAEPGRASAGTLFEVRQPDGVAYRASLQVATTNHFGQITTVPSLTAVGSLHLIAGGAHRNVAIARTESVTGHPLHEVVARFAGPAISSNSWLRARSSLSGPTLAPAQDESLKEGWLGEPVDSHAIWSFSDTRTQASSTRFFCPNECQLQFALEDDAEASEASRQIQAMLSRDVPLVIGKRVQLFRVGERAAWLEVRQFQSVPGKLAVFSGPNRQSGRSPVGLVVTNRLDSAVLSIPPNSELTLTAYIYDGKQSPALFTTALTSKAGQPGLFWLTWLVDHNHAQSNSLATTGWKIQIHDGLTTKELFRFHSTEQLNFNWEKRWIGSSNSVLPGVELHETLLTAGNAADKTASNRFRHLSVSMTMRPLPSRQRPQ